MRVERFTGSVTSAEFEWEAAAGGCLVLLWGSSLVAVITPPLVDPDTDLLTYAVKINQRTEFIKGCTELSVAKKFVEDSLGIKRHENT